MNDIIEFIDELKELHVLYKTGDLRDFDFARKIQKYEEQVRRYEEAMESDFNSFFKDTPFYSPTHEV